MIELKASHTKTTVIVCIVIFLVVMGIFFYWLDASVYAMEVFSYNGEYDRISAVTCEIESVRQGDEGIFTITGWALKEGEKIEDGDCHIVLRSADEKRFIRIPTEVVERGNIGKKYADDDRYKYCGFKAAFLIERLAEEPDMYTILIEYKNDGNEDMVDTGLTVKEYTANS